MRRDAEKTEAFTLVELLVVIGLLAFLAAIGLAGFGGAMDDTKAQVTQARLQKVKTSIETFHTKHGEWPPDPQQLPPKLAQWGVPVGTTWYEFMSHAYAKAVENGGPKFEYTGPWLELHARSLDQDGDILDAWLNPIRIAVDHKQGTVLVWSFGEDRQNATGDELYGY